MKSLPLYCPDCGSPQIHFKRGDGNAYCDACGFFPIYPVERVKKEPTMTALEEVSQRKFPTPWKVFYGEEEKARLSSQDSAQLYIDLHANNLALKTTETGFTVAEFNDAFDRPCSIEESIRASQPVLWLGADSSRMYLDRDMAAALIPLLWQFVATGKLR